MRLLSVTFVVAFLASLCLTPLVRRWARHWNIVDHPDEHRKLHQQATPLGGGFAVLLSWLLAIAVVLTMSSSQQARIGNNAVFLLGLLGAAVVICAVGLIDDRFGLRGRQKLFGQTLAASILLLAGLIIRRLEIFGVTLDLGPLAIPFTLFWLLGAINALNLIDGLDGLATSVGVVLCVAIALMASLANHPTEAFLALALAGGLSGFLMYNRPPATIFLGDAGSMLIGLVLGALAIRGAFKGPATVVLAAPTAILAIPILDVSMAVLRRRLTGRSIYATDRGHLHHTLLQHGFGNQKVVLFVALLCGVTAGGAALSVYMKSELLAFGAVVAVCALLVATRLFGHEECTLLTKKARNLAISLVPSFQANRGKSVQVLHRLRGNREWDELWETLTEFAERFDLTAVELNVSSPAIGEEFHASWTRKGPPPECQVWYSDIPLVAHQLTVGRLKITGASANGSVCHWMGDLIAGLEPFEAHLLDLLEDHPRRHGIAIVSEASAGHDQDQILVHPPSSGSPVG